MSFLLGRLFRRGDEDSLDWRMPRRLPWSHLVLERKLVVIGISRVANLGLSDDTGIELIVDSGERQFFVKLLHLQKFKIIILTANSQIISHSRLNHKYKPQCHHLQMLVLRSNFQTISFLLIRNTLSMMV